jgi:hypothetical protein
LGRALRLKSARASARVPAMSCARFSPTLSLASLVLGLGLLLRFAR